MPTKVLSTLALAVTLCAACTPPHSRTTTAGDARPPDRWLDGPRCSGGIDPSVLHIEVIEAGIGREVAAGETVRIHYVATLPTGETLRDTRQGLPHEIVIGSTPTICGFDKALVGMRPGEQRRVTVPWSLAFGEEGREPDIKPRTDLVFVIDLYLPGDADSSNSGGAARPSTGRGRGR